jgi:hypothetical protein
MRRVEGFTDFEFEAFPPALLLQVILIKERSRFVGGARHRITQWQFLTRLL